MTIENIIDHNARVAIDYVIRLLNDLQNDIKQIDSSTVTAMKAGLSLGVVLLTILTFFPGEPFGFEYRTAGTNKKIDANFDPKERTKRENCILAPEINDKRIEKMQQKFGLSKKEMELVLENSKKKEVFHEEDEEFCLSCNQTMNCFVYIAVLIALVVVINKDYNETASFWLVHFFPKEAATLNLIERE